MAVIGNNSISSNTVNFLFWLSKDTDDESFIVGCCCEDAGGVVDIEVEKLSTGSRMGDEEGMIGGRGGVLFMTSYSGAV